MSDAKRRLRVFAGPNGSGKSSLVKTLAKEFSSTGEFHLHHWINADEIEVALRSGTFDFGPYGRRSERLSLLALLAVSPRVGSRHPFLAKAQISGTIIVCDPSTVDSYIAATIADLLRTEMLSRGESFSFETVMSHPSKVEFMQHARTLDYLVYLYFVATRDVAINLSRIENRVQLGQHSVPVGKTVERYARSIRLLPAAMKLAYRAFLFDNSGDELVWFAEKTPDGLISLRAPQSDIPKWYFSEMEHTS